MQNLSILTGRERDCYRVVRDFIRLHRYPPSIKEVGKGLGVGVTRAATLMDGLEAKHYLRRDYQEVRGLTLLVETLPEELPVRPAPTRPPMELVCTCGARAQLCGNAARITDRVARWAEEHAQCSRPWEQFLRQVGGNKT